MTEKTAQENAVQTLNKLRDSYIDRLPGEIAGLEKLAHLLTGSNRDRDALAELHHLLHKLAGSGGSFGLNSLSRNARILEQRAKAWLAEDVIAIDEISLETFTAAISDLINDAGRAEKQAAPVQPETQLEIQDKRHHIWIIEDDEVLGPEVAAQLESFGYEVTWFSRIGDAEIAAATQQADLMLLDVILDKEGENTTQRLSELPNLKAIDCPRIFMSAYDDFQSRLRAARMGASGYFLKPLDIPRLVNRMAGLFKKKISDPPRVLIVDDDMALSAHYKMILSIAGMEVQTLDNPEIIIESISNFQPELIFMDLHMPDYSGIDLAGVIRQHDQWLSLPIVYLSAEDDFRQQISAMNQGADDFLTKPVRDEELISAARVRIDRARQLAEKIERDSLTGLLKHANIKQAASTEIKRFQHNNIPVTLIMIDIDHFKSVNDNFGHAVGDVVISTVASLLQQRLRHSDLIGRYGGEEFLVVMPECDIENAIRIIEAIRMHFSSIRFSDKTRTFNCTLSAGLACSTDFPGSQSAELLAKADEALYAAKNEGRNKIKTAPVKD